MRGGLQVAALCKKAKQGQGFCMLLLVYYQEMFSPVGEKINFFYTLCSLLFFGFVLHLL